MSPKNLLSRITLTNDLIIHPQKKALHALKSPKPEVEKPIAKRPADARDAREVARKLIKSGAIQAIQKPLKQDQQFKRPKLHIEKKPDRSLDSPQVPSTYQPYSAAHGDSSASPMHTPNSPFDDKETGRPLPNLYQQFASERDREERGHGHDSNANAGGATPGGPSGPSGGAPGGGPATPGRFDRPRTGNTIYVAGKQVTEEYLKKHFSSHGMIVNVSMEIEKGRGFITFTKPESAEKAIAEMHGKNVGGIQLQVQLARRQPQIEPINEASSSAAWSTIATNNSQKGSLKDKREQVVYDDCF